VEAAAAASVAAVVAASVAAVVLDAVELLELPQAATCRAITRAVPITSAFFFMNVFLLFVPS